MKALTRIERVKNAYSLLNVTLDVVHYVAGDAVGRALRRYLDNRPEVAVQSKHPATIKVKSERR